MNDSDKSGLGAEGKNSRGEAADMPLFARPATEPTLAEVKREHASRLHEGTTCQVCGRYDKIYRRPINSGMAWTLIALYRLDAVQPGWHHLLNEVAQLKGGDYGKLSEWGLIQKKDEAKEDGNPDAGFYGITSKGKGFVRGELRVQKYLYFYHDRLWPIEEEEHPEMVSIKDALGKKFDYEELMRPLPILA